MGDKSDLESSKGIFDKGEGAAPTELTDSRIPSRPGWFGGEEPRPEAARAAGAVLNRMPICTVATILSALLPRRCPAFQGVRGGRRAWSSVAVGLVPAKGLVKVGASALTDAFDIVPIPGVYTEAGNLRSSDPGNKE